MTLPYIAPLASPAPLEDNDFEDFLHDVFVGLTGLNPDLVRPRWQPEPPNIPDFGTDWLAFGITTIPADTYAVTQHDPAGNGSDSFQRHETVEVLLSAYGPNSMRTLSLLRDSIQVEQNRSVLVANGMGVIETTSMIAAPAMIKDRWTKRWDMTFRFRRQVLRVYQVLSLVSASGTINNEKYTTPFQVNPPAP